MFGKTKHDASKYISVVKSVQEKLRSSQGAKGKAIYKKIRKYRYCQKMKDLKLLSEKSNILEGIENSMENLENLQLNDL